LGDSEQTPSDLAMVADYTHLTALLAPRAVLLTYNKKDDCCFASDHALERWKDAFKVMRRNCETDWAQEYPQYVVSAWIGHNIQVSARRYRQVPEELFTKAAATNNARTATKTATNSKALTY